MPDPREPLGRLVHEQRLAHEADRAAAEGRQRFNLPPWEERDPAQQELDMRIGEAVAAAVRADAEAKLAAAESRAGEVEERYDRVTLRIRDLEEAEAKLAAITDACRSIPTPIAERILAIIAVTVPPVAALRAYLADAGWAEGRRPGLAGTLWAAGTVRVGVPHDDSDPGLVRTAVERVARTEGRTPAETTAAILAVTGTGGTQERSDDKEGAAS